MKLTRDEIRLLESLLSRFLDERHEEAGVVSVTTRTTRKPEPTFAQKFDMACQTLRWIASTPLPK